MNRSIASMLVATFVLRVSTAVTGGMLVYLVDELTKNKGTGPGAISVLTGGFYTTELTGAIVFGVLADRYGRKVIMLLGPIFGSVAVFMTGLTTMMPVLFVTRLLEGGSTAASIPSTLGFIAAETAHDERLRGRVVSLFELVSLGGMLAIGPWLAGHLWEAWGRPAFFLNCGLYLVALTLYAYGVHEVPKGHEDELEGHAAEAGDAPGVAGVPGSAGASGAGDAGQAAGVGFRRYWRLATSRSVLLFAPTWLAINAILGLWALQAPLLLRGNIHDPSQFLMRGISAGSIGDGSAVLAVVFGLGLLFWGTVYARFRRTTMLLVGVGAFVVMAADVLAINHLGDQSTPLLVAMGIVAVLALFAMSGATPAALGLLADVSEGFEEDRSAIMGLYSVFLGLGQVLGAVVGGLFATWKGIDGLLVATAILLTIGLVALANLRRQDVAGIRTAMAGAATTVPIGSLRDTLSGAAGGGGRRSAGEPKENR
jgi:MFS family permease